MKTKKKRPKTKRELEQEVFDWNEDNPADKVGKPLVWNPDDIESNETILAMKPPKTKYKSRGEFLTDGHQHDKR